MTHFKLMRTAAVLAVCTITLQGTSAVAADSGACNRACLYGLMDGTSRARGP